MFNSEIVKIIEMKKQDLKIYLSKVKYLLRPIKIERISNKIYKIYLDNRGNACLFKDLRVVAVTNILKGKNNELKTALIAAHGDAHGLVAAAGSFFKLCEEDFSVRLLFGKATGDVKFFWEKTFYSIPFECYDIVLILDIPEKKGRIMPTNTLYIDHHGTGLKVDEVFYGDPGDLYKRLALLADHETDPKNREEELIQLGLSIAPFEPSNIDPELRAIEAVDRLISKDLEYFVKLGEVFESKCLELSQKASFIENTAILEFPQNFEYKLIWPVLHYIRLKRKIKVVIGYKRVKNNIYQVNIVASAPLDAPSIANALRGTNILILSEKALSMRVRKSFLSKISQLAKYL